MSKIQSTLAKATEVEPKKDESIIDQGYMKRLALAVGELSDKDWEALPGPAQDWVNEASDAVNAKKDIAPFADYEKPAETTTRRRKAADADETPTAQKREMKKGDKVKVTTKRDKVYSGTVVDPDDGGLLVLDTGEEELEIKLEGLVIEFLDTPAEEPTWRRRKSADADEPASNPEPEVGDTVEIKTKRGKQVMGNVVEINDEIVVIKTAAGDEEEFDKDRVESITVKVKASKGGRSSKAEAKDEPAKEDGKAKKTTKDDNGGVSVTTRARELMVENLAASKDEIVAMLKKEKLEFKENTIQLIYGDVHKLVGMLKARKMLK